MCRLAAYSGPEISLEKFIISPPHSLYRQAWEPKEMLEAKLNADGFGFCWYQDNTAKRYRNTQPIWSDPNLPDLANSLRHRLWLAAVRSATPGQGMGTDNTQPFVHQAWSFLHNGYIGDFTAIKPALFEALGREYLASVCGNTDSEYLFALFRQSLAESQSIPATLQHFWSLLKDICQDNPLMLGIIISDGEQLYAFKQSIAVQAPSLYYSERMGQAGKALTIASEPFDPQHDWTELHAGQLLTVDAARTCQIDQIP